MRYMVRGIPTVMLFKDGQIVDQIVGLVDKSTLKQMVDRHIDTEGQKQETGQTK
jgi:thioredoxin 1